ncbi:helix-turn-helix domain-containing protein [Chryseobacterium carnipullorum]|uniref:Helix-turn-helix domain-containing protein n=1 Tax=Chryseobacterium carnipullorum TaxID=1124835 RepID=A0A1M7EWW0_CHRCU|nr:helix-turn-helix domain-containing protein [Chryseobacterium carnipullorum]AZA49831.1 helix-turn-helix domain-containing protein [Chryseobacterium carnipullorum]AZA64720.1 helix-turn-helix domain-containing protein [Chryseobacterium carnipullorum]SHL96166.1 Helix-turn-helix domain-containing protein [Chryseobacterium carnipullorum]HBV17419.1 transposase [Chryseobacterium carnipullorum]
MNNLSPDYKRIYTDIINKNHPEKRELCQKILEKSELSILDILKLNALIFTNAGRETLKSNQQLRSYDKSTICEILEYQRKNNYTNHQLALHFKLSKNTITKWKKLFPDL